MIKKNYTIILFLLTLSFYILTQIYIGESSRSDETTVNTIIQHDMLMKKTTDYFMNTINTKDDDIQMITIDRSEQIVEDYRYHITDDEFAEFVRVVEAEVTGEYPFGTTYEEAFKCKLHVAQVILNRVESPYFPDTVHDVIFQKNAFTPLIDGRYYEVDISQVTIDACRAALLESTPDTTYGCEFFISGSKTCKYGSYVFTDEVGHSFFKYYRTY